MSEQDSATGHRGEGSIATDRRGLRKVIGGSAIGNGIEWYDYAIYGFLATAIQANFLPAPMDRSTTGTIITFVIFAVPFLFRPLGGAIFGALGDRVGRQKILALTVLLISGGTFLIGVLPGFSVLGWLAPFILVLLRVVQGLAAGGEYGGAATFMAEHAPDNKRGFYGSFLEFGTLSGFLAGSLLGSALQAFMSAEAFLAWGWRIPFLLAAPIGLFGLYMRAKLEESPVFTELVAEGKQEHETKTQLRDLVKHWRPIAICAGMVFMLNVHNYTLFVYMVEYLADPERGGLSGSWSLGLTAIMYAVMMILMPLGGAASDRFGRKPSWYLSGISLFLLALPAFYFLLHGNLLVKIIALLVLGICYVPQLSTISATFPALFPTHVRFTAFALTYNVATAVAGGPTPAINEALTTSWTDYFPAFYMMGASIIGIVAVYFAPETAGASLRGTEIPDAKRSKRARVVPAPA
ncbi:MULTISPECIES: MFS transporter [Thermocrispum]|uniref:Putative proline/betaine transporter n=1 Tax=Thermocrispum agreste TaxID=37925 RepID=A0ABD6FBN8_9PSEU|nr:MULTISPECIES: MFS transporter [Thermocrispum]